jgi:hypothetical protein
MANTVSIIGVDPEELAWIRLVIGLLRHPDPGVPELVRHALMYLADTSDQFPTPAPDSVITVDNSSDNQYRSTRNLVS